MVCRDFILPEPASYVFFYALSNLRNLLYIINNPQQRKAALCFSQSAAFMLIYLYLLCIGKLTVAELEQFGNVYRGDVPNDFKIDAAVIVCDKVSHSLDLMPLNVVLCLAAVFLRQSADQLADLQNTE